MPQERIHRTASRDGTEIAGIVQGEGPPVVLLHAGLGDGELDWGAALPFLRERFTCHLMSYRRRGRSGDHPDLSPDRLAGDVTSFAESIGEPVGIAAPSGGGMMALAAAARTDAVAAVAVYEPIVFEALGEEEGAEFQEAFARMDEQAAHGRLVEAARDWIDFFASDEEMAALGEAGYFEGSARYVPVLLDEIRHAMEFDGPGPTDPEVLQRITAPVLLLEGARTTLDWYRDGVRHVVEHVPNARVEEIPGAGHFGVWVEAEPVCRSLTSFFQARLGSD